MFPYMFFVGLMAISMGVLNSMRHFAAPAISPVFFNISIISCVFLVAPLIHAPVYALAIGVLIGGFLQFAIQVPVLGRYGFSPNISLRFKDPAIKRILLLMGPAAFGVGVYQLNIFVTLWFSSRLPEGSVSYLYYAGRLMEMPLGVFSVAVTTAALPSLSEHVTKKDWTGFRDSFSFAMRINNFVTIPATFGLFALSYPIIDALFKRGEFGGEDVAGTAIALYYYAIGLVPVAASRILMSVFYSIKDTVTPVWVAFVSFVFNAILCVMLIGPLGHGGLALATSVSGALNTALLLVLLRKKFGKFGGRFILLSAIKSLIASVVMAGVIFLILLATGFEGISIASKAIVIAVCMGFGFLSYISVARLLNAPEIAFLKGILKRGA
jgi:putative peptidoglycan lipid II flippase